MSSVDNRAVNMQFNGSQFLSGVGQAIGALERLDKALNLTGSQNGLDKISKAADKINLSHVDQDVQSLANRFSTLGVVGMSMLNQLSTRAFNVGANMVNALTLAPVAQGWNEMELKMKSVQTILANTSSRYGTTIDDVTGALDELNHYADKTIYNFAEMTQNIGRFTTAGIDLDTSVEGIKGLANLGAFFNADNASVMRAMYQMSQGLAAGSIKLMDWNSLVNANMGGSEFVEDIERVARKHGVAIDDMIAKEGSFRETLRSGWLTNDIFLESLNHFATDVDAIGEDTYRAQLAAEGWSEAEIDKIVYLGRTANEAATKVRTWTQLWDTLQEEAGSGWAQTWETIFGNFEESTELFNGAYKMLNPIISGMGDWRNNLLEGWKNLGGRDSLIGTLTQMGENGIGIFDMVAEAAQDAFDINPQGLYDATEAFGEFIDSLQLGGDAIRDAQDTFEGFFSFFDIIGQLIGFGAGVFGELFQAIFPLFDGILDLTGLVGGGISGFDDWLKSTNLLSDGLKGLHDILQPVRDGMKGVSDFVGQTADQIKEGGKGIGDAISSMVEDASGKIANGENPMQAAMDSFFGGIQKMFSGEGVDNAVSGGKSNMDKIGETVSESFKGFTAGFRQADDQMGVVTPIVEDISGGLAGISSMLGNVPWGDILAVVGIFGTAIAFKELSNTFNAVKRTVGGFKGVLDGLKGMFNGVESLTKDAGKMMKYQGLASLVSSIALVVAALAALTAVEGLNPGAIGRVLGPLSIILGELVIVTEILARGKLDAVAVGRATALAAVIDALSLAFVAIAASLALLGDIQPENLTNATIALGSLFALLGVMEKFMSTNFSFEGEKFSAKSGTSGLLRSAVTILAMAGAMKTIAEAVAGLGSLNPESLQNGLNGMIQIMGSFALLIAALGLVNSTITTSGGGSFRGGTNTWRSIASMIVAVQAIKGLAEVVQEFAYMPATAMQQGISSVSALALGLAGMMAALSGITKGLGSVSFRNTTALLGISIAIGMLADIAAEVSQIPDAGGAILNVGFLAGIITAVVGIMSLLNTGIGQSFGQATLLMSFIGTLKGMVDVLKGLGDMGGIDITALGELFALLAGLVASVAVMSKTAGNAKLTSLLGLAAIIGSVSSAMKTLSGIPIEGVASALIALAGAFTVIGVATSLLGGLGPELILVAGAFDLFAVGAIAFAGAVWLIASALSILSTLTGPALANLAMAIPKIIESIANGVMDAIEAVSRRSGELVPALIEIFTNALKGVAGAAGELAKTVVELLIQTFKMVGEYAPQLVDALVTMLCNIFAAVGQNAGRIMGSIKGLVDAIGKAFNESFGELELDPAAVDHIVLTMYEIFGLIFLMKASGVGIKDAIKVAGELLLVFGPMVGLFALISLVADQDATAALEQINNSLALIAAVCIAFSIIPVAGAVNAIVGLDLFIANLAVVLAALGALKQIPGLEWLIEEGGDFLGTIGEAIGKFIGGIGGGIASQFSESFGPIGENLAEFAENAGPFFEMIQGMDSGVSEKVDAFKQVIESIGGMALNGQYGTQKLEALGEFLPELAETMKTFSEDTKDLNVDNVTAVSGFLDAVSSIIDHLPEKVPGANTDSLFGQMTLSQFGTELTTFASDLKTVIAEIGPSDSFDTSGITAVIDAATQLNTLQQSLPEVNDGGSAWWTGTTQTLSSFSKGIDSFATAMDDFRTKFPSAEGLDLTGVDAVVELAKELVQIQVDLANATKMNGGMLDWSSFMGIEEFGRQIGVFADNLHGKDLSFKEFGAEGNYSPARARNLISLISGLADIQVSLAEVKTTSGWGGSESVMKIGGLAKDLADHIDAFTTLASAVGEMTIDEDTTTKFDNFGACLESLAGVQARLMGYDGTGGETAGTKVMDLASFVSSLAGEGSTFLTDVQALTSGAVGLDPSGISNLQTVCAQLGSLITTLGTIEPEQVDNIDGFVSAIERIRTAFGSGTTIGGLIGMGSDTLGESIDFTDIAANITTLAGAIPELISAFDGLQGTVGEGGEGAGATIQSFVESLQGLVAIDFAGALETVQSSVEQIKTSINDTLTSMSETFTAKAEEFKAQGAAMGTALIDGMNSAGTGNTSSLEGLAQQALDAIAGKLGDFYTKGQESGQKYIDGVTDQQGPAGDAGEELGTSAASGAEGGYDSFYSAGSNAAQGYVDGIKAQISAAKTAAAELASVAINATNSTQESHSPSRVFRRIGRWAGQGYSLGIRDEYDNVENTAYDLVSNALDVAYELSQRELDFNPKIEPVVDLTKMGEGLDGAMHMLNGLQATANDTTLGLTADVQGRFAEAEAASLAMPEQQQPVNNVTYNQTINSPKALSRTDIWRDTKSLLAQKKEAAVR